MARMARMGRRGAGWISERVVSEGVIGLSSIKFMF